MRINQQALLSGLMLWISASVGCGGSAAPEAPVPTTRAAPAPAITAPATSTAAASGPLVREHRIGAHDVVDIKVLESEELSGSFRVSTDGDISIPLLGVVDAAGLTARELEQRLQKKLRATYIHDPHVTVQLSEVQSNPISVLGAVKTPGVLPVRGSRRLTEVLALAGGLTQEAGDRVIVVRGNAATAANAGDDPDAVEVDLRSVMETADPQHDVHVHPGDVVKVVPAGLAYIVGEVNKPGAFAVTGGQPITVLQAIAVGEGMKPNAARGHVQLIRTLPSGERKTYRIAINDVLSGKAVDPPLEAKDVVFVPSSARRSFALGAVDALVRMVTLRAVF